MKKFPKERRKTGQKKRKSRRETEMGGNTAPSGVSRFMWARGGHGRQKSCDEGREEIKKRDGQVGRPQHKYLSRTQGGRRLRAIRSKHGEQGKQT